MPMHVRSHPGEKENFGRLILTFFTLTWQLAAYRTVTLKNERTLEEITFATGLHFQMKHAACRRFMATFLPLSFFFSRRLFSPLLCCLFNSFLSAPKAVVQRRPKAGTGVV